MPKNEMPPPPKQAAKPAPKPSMQMPSIALAKSAPKEGSAAWMRQMAKAHGVTEPLQIEKRRERLSSLVITLNRSIKEIQTAKQALKVSSVKQIGELIKTRSQQYEAQQQSLSPAAREQWTADTEKAVEEMKAVAFQQNIAYEISIAQLMGMMAQAEGMCLIVDCLSLRIPGVKSNGKRGLFRYSAADYLQDVAWGSAAGLEMLAKAFKIPIPRNADDGDEEEDDDDDVMTPEEREAMRKEGEESDATQQL